MPSLVALVALAAAVPLAAGGRRHRFNHPVRLDEVSTSPAFAAAKQARASADDCPTWDKLPHPGIFMLGTQKSGSATLYAALALHPDVVVTLTTKEPNFFLDLVQEDGYEGLTDAEIYERYLDTAFNTNIFVEALEMVEAGDLRGFLTMDASIITYKRSHLIAPLLHRVLPCSFYIFTARNPLAQIHSYYWHIQLHHPDQILYPLEEALAVEVETMRKCRHELPANVAELMSSKKNYMRCLKRINHRHGYLNFLDHALYGIHLAPVLKAGITPTVLCFELWTQDTASTVDSLVRSFGLSPLTEDAIMAIQDMSIETHRLPNEIKPRSDLPEDLVRDLATELEPAVKLFYDLFDVDCGWDLTHF